tara:strand:+ start:690 stop:839 length:150 start_codon:yes stop_codon:yes gene_type:complete
MAIDYEVSVNIEPIKFERYPTNEEIYAKLEELIDFEDLQFGTTISYINK